MGEPADLVNGLIYAAEKDYINAGISMAAVIPVVGDAGKAVKYGAKAIEKSKGLKKMGKTVTKPLSKKATKTYQAGKKSFKKKADKIKVLSYREAEEIAFDAIHGSPKAGAVVLGKYGDGGPTSYTSIAKGMDAQYFQLDNWEEIAEAYSEDEI